MSAARSDGAKRPQNEGAPDTAENGPGQGGTEKCSGVHSAAGAGRLQVRIAYRDAQALAAIRRQPGITREQLDQDAQCSNGPDCVFELRHALELLTGVPGKQAIRTTLEPIRRPDGRPTHRARYSLATEVLPAARELLKPWGL